MDESFALCGAGLRVGGDEKGPEHLEILLPWDPKLGFVQIEARAG